MWILVLSSLLVTGSQPCLGKSGANISVTDNGNDYESCLFNGSFPCRTLHYVLEFLSSARPVSISAAAVMVRAHQQMQPKKYSLPPSISLVIKGNTKAYKTQVTCSGRGPLTFHSPHGSVAMEGLAFKKCSGPHGIGLSDLSFLDCTATDGRGIGIIDTARVRFVSSVFAFVQPYSREGNLVLSHTAPATTSVFISNCTFSNQYYYSWSAAACIWVTNGNVHVNGNVTIANCTGYLGGAFGSAAYLEGVSCPLLDTSNGVLTVRVTNSKHSCVFIENPASLSTCLSLTTFPDFFGNDSNCSLSTSATSLSVQLDSSTSVIIPGMDVVMNLLVTDYFQNSATCEGGVYLSLQSGATVQCNSPVGSVYISCPLYMPQKQFMTFVSELGWNSTVQFKSIIEPGNANDNCYSNRAELLCSKCKDGYYFSFPPLRCLPSVCSLAHSFGMLIILITFEFTKVIIIFLVVSNKLGAVFPGTGKGGVSRRSLGVGYFFGSLFFMASIGRLPILSLPQFYALKWIVEAFRTITHLPLDIVGEIQWCFFPSFGALGIFACQYLGPAVAAVMLAAMYIFVRLCPKVLSKFHPSPMQSISLLILFTFWSVAATSINILQYIEVKPFLDEFQSCYKKSYRWYPAIYFVAWLVIVGVDSVSLYLTIYTVVFFTLCILLAVFQPYEVHWLNTVDMLLLLDLLVTTMLLLQQTLLDAEDVVITGMVYVLMLVPLLFISGGISILFAMQCRVCKFRRQKAPAPMEETAVPLVKMNQPAKIGETFNESWRACRSRDSIITDSV
ncbi:hypothetical protein EMCRGX_G022689 [Ephydatia muelleri]|eukprot:Em0401g5a